MTEDDLFIISNNQIERFGDYVEDDKNQTEEKYKNARGLAGTIRSTPLSPNVCVCGLSQTECQERTDIIRNEALKAGREKVLSELTTLINKNSPWYEHNGIQQFAIPNWRLERWITDIQGTKQEEPFDPCGKQCENCPSECRADPCDKRGQPQV